LVFAFFGAAFAAETATSATAAASREVLRIVIVVSP
jgi:hypothetical protein